MFETRTPLAISDKILALCQSISKSESPVYVQCKPEPYAQINECIPAVKKKVKECGGRIRYGWQIWEWPNVLIEAEFHSIWVSPDGQLLDITPKPWVVENILFLPDTDVKYEGKQINNLRVAIGDNPMINDFISICDAIFRFENKGEESVLYEWLHEMMLLTHNMIKSGLTRNGACPCGSGMKYKACHGKKLYKKLGRI